MNKYVRFMWQYFLATSVLGFALHCTWTAIAHHSVDPIGPLLYWVLIALLAVPSVLLFRGSAAQKQLFKLLCQQNRLLKFVHLVCNVLLIASLIASCLYSSSVVWRASGWIICQIASKLNQDEIAEITYKHTNLENSSEYSYLGYSLKGLNRTAKQSIADYEKQNCLLDGIIERVYGPTSSQMANRYSRHGGRAYCCENYVLAVKYYEKSAGLYKKLNWPEKELCTRRFLLYTYCELKQFELVNDTLFDCRELLAKANFADESHRVYQDAVDSAAVYKVDVAAHRAWLSTVPKIKPQNSRITGIDFWLAYAILLTPFTTPYVMLLCLRWKTALVAESEWRMAVSQASSIPDYIEAAGKVIVLELARSNVALAERYSHKCMEVAIAWKKVS